MKVQTKDPKNKVQSTYMNPMITVIPLSCVDVITTSDDNQLDWDKQ